MPANIVHQTGGKVFHKINQINRPIAPARAFYIIPSFTPKKNRTVVFFQHPVGGQTQNARTPTRVSYYYHLRPSLAYFRVNRFNDFINRFFSVAVHRFQPFAYSIRLLLGLSGEQIEADRGVVHSAGDIEPWRYRKT